MPGTEPYSRRMRRLFAISSEFVVTNPPSPEVRSFVGVSEYEAASPMLPTVFPLCKTPKPWAASKMTGIPLEFAKFSTWSTPVGEPKT